MGSKQIHFFATKQDLQPIMKLIEADNLIKYVEIGMFDREEVSSFESYLDLPNVGFTKFQAAPTLDQRYMLCPKNSEVKARKVPQRKGGIRWAIDPMTNGGGVEFSPAGISLVLEDVIVVGRCGISVLDDFSTNLYEKIAKAIRSHFRKVNWVFVGEEAFTKLMSGWRLVRDASLSSESDLAPD